MGKAGPLEREVGTRSGKIQPLSDFLIGCIYLHGRVQKGPLIGEI